MKRFFLPGVFLFAFCFTAYGQVDSAAVEKEVDSLIQISRTLTGKREFDKALEVNGVAEKQALEKLGKESVAYGNACFNHGRVFHSQRNYAEAEKWYLESQLIREKIVGKEHISYAASLNGLANVYMSSGNPEKAVAFFLETKAIREKVLGKQHADYTQSLNSLGNVYMFLGKYDKAEPYYQEARDIREKTAGKESVEYAQSLHNLGYLNWRMGNNEKAEIYYLEAKAIKEKAGKREAPDFAQTLNNLAAVYVGLGSYEKAEPLYLEAKEIREKVLGKLSPDYAQSLNNLALLYWDLGHYEKAESLHLEAKAIREKIVGKEHLDYAQSLNNLAALYTDMGNYQKAEPLHLESNDIQKKKLGTEHPDYALSLNNLAALYIQMGDFAKAEQIHLESNAIMEKALGKEHPHYSANLANLGNMYLDMGNYQKAEPLLLEAGAIREKTLGKEHPDYARSVNILGILYRETGDYKKAVSLSLEALSIREKVLGKDHPDFSKSLNDLALAYWASGNFTVAGPAIREAGKSKKALLLKASRYLSEQELASYTAKFYIELNQGFSFARYDPAVAGDWYDNTLFFKGFMLNTASRANTLALNDPASSEIYLRFKSFHRRLGLEYTKPIAERADVAALESQANALEKELVRSVAGFGEAIRQVGWQEVQKALKPGEAAIEFIRFNYYNPKTTDSVLYAALLLKPGMEVPDFITLFEEKQLQSILSPLATQGSSGLNELYGGKAGHALYQLIWSPIEPQLGAVKTIYLSPAGLLHRLNLTAIPTGRPNESIGKRYTIATVTSTRQRVAVPPNANATASIFGGIRYEMDSTAIPQGRANEPAHRDRGLTFSQTDSTLRGDTWAYLKYSEKEADNVQSILQKAGYQATANKGYAATEEAFKQLSKDQVSPRILHLSTHGFFFPDPQSKGTRQSTVDGAEPVFKVSDNPMIRSGLILAGANHAWVTGKPLGNREDGILTAYEISQMDLRGTELVVLSACETGLGDIQGNEGVYGLQRAFKIAGAHNLIMSLWQVPDLQTQEMMTVFYQKWLDEKMTVRDALKAAQEEMQRKRYEPFYWAGFVLVE